MREEKTITYAVISKQIENCKNSTNQLAKVVIEDPDGNQYTGREYSWLFDRGALDGKWPEQGLRLAEKQAVIEMLHQLFCNDDDQTERQWKRLQ